MPRAFHKQNECWEDGPVPVVHAGNPQTTQILNHLPGMRDYVELRQGFSIYSHHLTSQLCETEQKYHKLYKTRLSQLCPIIISPTPSASFFFFFSFLVLWMNYFWIVLVVLVTLANCKNTSATFNLLPENQPPPPPNQEEAADICWNLV